MNTVVLLEVSVEALKVSRQTFEAYKLIFVNVLINSRFHLHYKQYGHNTI